VYAGLRQRDGATDDTIGNDRPDRCELRRQGKRVRLRRPRQRNGHRVFARIAWFDARPPIGSMCRPGRVLVGPKSVVMLTMIVIHVGVDVQRPARPRDRGQAQSECEDEGQQAVH
jgi:hypothetical protein